jgi:hypothetical protein
MNSAELWLRSCLGKKRYSTYRFASKLVERSEKERGINLYIYPCKTCSGFHLTKRKTDDMIALELRVSK